MTREKWRRGGVIVRLLDFQTNFHSEDQRIHGSRLKSASAEKMLHSTFVTLSGKTRVNENCTEMRFNEFSTRCECIATL